MSELKKKTCFVLFVILFVVSSEALKFSSIKSNYKKGVEAYSAERWSECISQFEEAIHLFKLYKSVVYNCRLKCNSQNYASRITENIEDLKIYERFFNKRQCLYNCQEKGFKDVQLQSDLEEPILFEMMGKKPYSYLHMCYFEMNMLPKAASAAFTYLVSNPSNDDMRNNLEYYIQQPEVDVGEVIDLESEDYKVLFKLGLKAYKQKNWGETIANMEEVLIDYFSWENLCRVECERQPEQEWSPEFAITMSNNIASLMQCRQQCQQKLKELEYNSGLEFLADVLNYIQISYYHLGKLKEAARTVASYLVLMPYDEHMLENKNIYETLTESDAFVERSDITYYLKRDSYEKDLLHFFHQENDNSNPNAI